MLCGFARILTFLRWNKINTRLQFDSGPGHQYREKQGCSFMMVTSNGKMYRDILTKALPEIKNLMGTRNWTFVHDGASAHKDEKTNDWLEENVPHYIKSGPDCDWPARSPDLNYIENLFGILADGMSEGDPVQTVEELKAKLEAVWANIPIETLQACVAGVYCAVLV
jgi:hypothetical protein